MKTTITVATRCNPKHLAMVLDYFTNKGMPPKSGSELGRMAIEGFAHLLHAQGVEEPTSEEGLARMEAAGLRFRNTSRTRDMGDVIDIDASAIDAAVLGIVSQTEFNS